MYSTLDLKKDHWDLYPGSVHGIWELSYSFAPILHLLSIIIPIQCTLQLETSTWENRELHPEIPTGEENSWIYTQKVSTGEENSLMALLDICSLLGPMGFIPRKCPWEKRTPWSSCPKTAFNNLTCNPPPPPTPSDIPGDLQFFFFLEGLFPTPEDTERDNNWENSHRREFHWGVFLISYRVYMFALPVPVYSPDRNEWWFRVYMKLLWSFVQEWNSHLGTTTRVNSSRRPILWWCKRIQSHEREPEWTLAVPIVAPEHVNTPYQKHVLMLINHTLTWSDRLLKFHNG